MALKLEAADQGNVVCMSALTGEGMEEFYAAVERKIKVQNSSKLKAPTVFGFHKEA